MSDKVYIIKDKNVFTSNYDEISTNIQEIVDQYQRIKTEMNLDLTIKIDINPDNVETEINIKALIAKIKEDLSDGSIDITQKYVYKLNIHGGWKMYPIHSMDYSKSLLHMLETSFLILDLDNFLQLFTSNEFYNLNYITLSELSIIQQFEITKIGN